MASLLLMAEALTTYLLHLAYREGAFPMADDRTGEIDWYQANRRALFPIDGIHLSRSMRKSLKTGEFEFTFDQEFEQVMRGCMREKDNWLNDEIIRVFTLAHHEGWAHSGEVWHEEELVGGIYGLAIGQIFSAESMFHRRTNASKAALWAMVEKCREVGFTIFDAQIMNPHLATLGAYEIPVKQYLTLLRDAANLHTEWSCKSPYI